jgi:DNA-binding NtrC family response regulator
MNSDLRTCHKRHVEDRLSVLAVVGEAHRAETERILAHTRWRYNVVESLEEAAEALRTSPPAVILCDCELAKDVLPRLVHQTGHPSPRPQTIIISPDARLWEEVAHYDGNDIVVRPLKPEEVYNVVPMAWRRWKHSFDDVLQAETSSGLAFCNV